MIEKGTQHWALLYTHMCKLTTHVCIHTYMHRKRELKRERERETETDRERQTDRQTERQREGIKRIVILQDHIEPHHSSPS